MVRPYPFLTGYVVGSVWLTSAQRTGSCARSFLFAAVCSSLRLVWVFNLFWKWGERTVSPCLHAHSTTVDFTMAKTTAIPHADIRSLPACAKHSRTPYSRLSIVLLIHAPARILVHPHAGIVGCCCSCTGAILVLPTSFFLCRFVSGEVVSFPHGLCGGFCIVTICTAD